MAAEGREKEIPRYVIVSDFQRFVLYDLEPETQRDLPLFAGRRYEATEFPLAELHKHIHAFAFIHGYKLRSVGRRNEPASDPLISDASAPAGAGTAQRTVPTTACTLADLYDPLSMPPELVQAHAELDRAVEKCYRPEPFKSDRERVEYLFSLYEKLTAPLLPATPKAKTRRQSQRD